MKEKKIKFIIASTHQNNGGSIVLYLLCKLLTEKGYDARIFKFKHVDKKIYKNAILFWLAQFVFIVKDIIKIFIARFFINENNYSKRYDGYYYMAVRGCKRLFFPFFNKKKTIVVYPEIVYGNFLNARNIVRWFLYYNRYEDVNAFCENDLFFAFREVFNDRLLNPNNKVVTLFNFDYDLYRQTNFSKRHGTCYIIRKGKKRSDLPEKIDGIVIDQLSEYQIVKVFNECEYCISYDTQTFYTRIAAFCGCKVIVVPEVDKSRIDYLGTNNPGYGISYSFDENEIEWAEQTKPLLKERIQSYDTRNNENIEYFIDECEKYFHI